MFVFQEQECLHNFERKSQDSSTLKPVKTLTQTLKKASQAILTAVAISSLQIGDKVLAYNESTDSKGTYEVTDVHSHETPIYELKLETNSKKLEVIETTAEHPFFVQKFGNKIPRPKAEGHEDLSSHWVGTKDLVKGDVLRRSSGVGRVLEVKRTARVEVVWNISVQGAGTYFVGDGQWLVHNCNIGEERLLKVAQDFDVLGSGFPTNVKGSGIVRGDVDLIVQDGNIIGIAEVGGDAKGDLSKLGQQLAKLQQYAAQFGGTPTFFYDSNTPAASIQYAIRILGAGNVIPIPPKRW